MCASRIDCNCTLLRKPKFARMFLPNFQQPRNSKTPLRRSFLTLLKSALGGVFGSPFFTSVVHIG